MTNDQATASIGVVPAAKAIVTQALAAGVETEDSDGVRPETADSATRPPMTDNPQLAVTGDAGLALR